MYIYTYNYIYMYIYISPLIPVPLYVLKYSEKKSEPKLGSSHRSWYS